MNIKDAKSVLQKIREQKNKENEIFNQILLDYLHSIPAHKNSEIKICSIKPTLAGIYIVWRECGILQRYARTIKYHEISKLTKEFLQP